MRAIASDGIVVLLSSAMVALSTTLLAIQSLGYWTEW
jgi:hypothetical protein